MVEMINREQLMSRQSELVSPLVEEVRVAIVGLGGIGSNVAEVLARIGVRHFTLYDGDVVEAENVYPGAFWMDQVGEAKASAVEENLHLMGVDYEDVELRDYFNPRDEHNHHDIWIVGTDTMESRREVWYALDRGEPLFDTYIDARMGGAGFEIYRVAASDFESRRQYRDFSLDNVRTQELPCGQKATAYLTRMIAGMVGEIVRAHTNGVSSDMPSAVYYDEEVGMATD